jgi:hypothetical protein
VAEKANKQKRQTMNPLSRHGHNYRVSFSEIDPAVLGDSLGRHVAAGQYVGPLMEVEAGKVPEGSFDLAREVHLTRWIVDNEVDVLCAT